MKKIMLFIGLLLYVQCGMANPGEARNSPSDVKTIRVFTTPDLVGLTTQWAQEFCRLHPDVQINVIKASESTLAENLSSGGNLGFVSSGYFGALKDPSVWQIVVGRDVIVPVFNSNNPLLVAIDQQGISPEALARLFEKNVTGNWGVLLKNGQNLPVHYYTTGDESINSKVANFLGSEQGIQGGVKVKSEAELIAAIQKDPYALGFCKMINVVDISNQGLVGGIKLLPIDRNNNGRIDYIENIYDNLNTFSRAVWIGKYPRSLSSNIYSVSSAGPSNNAEVAFLKWVVTDGQQYLFSYGYSNLAISERQAKLDKLSPATVAVGDINDLFSTQAVVLLIIAGIVVLVLITNVVVWFSLRRKGIAAGDIIPVPSAFNEASVNIPNGLYFDRSHTWAFMEKDGIVRVGIDDFLQHTTGPLTRTILKNPGDKIKKGEQIITLVQNGKQLNISSPVSGIIKGLNKSLVKNPDKINTSPYGDGWVYMIEPSNWSYEIGFLKMAGLYKEWIRNEYARLKDFLALSANTGRNEEVQFAFQSGGELKDNVLQHLGPELWEDFQRNFIDTSDLR
ncbi:MAG: hypothetical protein IH595_06300 [Bacteroidales bacterium]|nr:hypothetical protein [Bacteroidales bacterium]